MNFKPWPNILLGSILHGYNISPLSVLARVSLRCQCQTTALAMPLLRAKTG